jgi:P-loop Domain of unknown function (DUF2791)
MRMDHDQFICQSIVRALKRGLVPPRELERIVVGRESELGQVRRDLEFRKSGGGRVKFVSGDYGVGKTFLCSPVREIAWREGFVVAALDLGRDAPFHKLEVIYRRIVDGMRTGHLRTSPPSNSSCRNGSSISSKTSRAGWASIPRILGSAAKSLASWFA